MNRSMKRLGSATAFVAATVLLLIGAYRPNIALASKSSSEAPRACVMCDRCNASENNHLTGSGGARTGVSHDCFTGSTCLVHDLSSSCGGEETFAEVKQKSSESVPWTTLASGTGKEFQETLESHRDRWVLNEERQSIQWKDCFGNIVANLPLAAGQKAVALAVVKSATATVVGEDLDQE